jgi:hypothetical protein
VQFKSRAVRPRVDLAPLAARLNAEETAAGGTSLWMAQPVSALSPTLAPTGGDASSLSPVAVVASVTTHLRAAPPAWDPFAITR